MSMPFPTIEQAGKFDPSNPLHQQSARAFYDNLQTMTAQNGGDQTAAMQLYKDTQAKYGFTDQQFAPYTTSNVQTRQPIPNQNNYSAPDVNTWKNSGNSGNRSLGLPPMATAAAMAPMATAAAPTMASYSRSPYLDAMDAGIQQQATQNLNNNIMPNIRYGAQAAGGFGDTRQGVAEGNAIAQTQSAIAAQKAQAGQTDYTNFQNNAMQKYSADSNLALGNAQNANNYNLGMGNLALGNLQANNNYNLGQDNLALGNRQADNAYSLGQGNLSLGNLQANNNYSLGQGNLALGNTQANNSFGLGLGNLGLGAMQANNSYNLGLGGLGLNAQTNNQNFYTNQRGQDLQAIGLGANLTGQGNSGMVGQGQGVTNIGNTQQNAPWQVINNANSVMNPYAAQGQGATQTQNGSMFGGAVGGALAGAQLAKLWGNNSGNNSNYGSGINGSGSWSTGGGQWNNPSAYTP